MPRAVLLLHTLPDGSSHHDWMIERFPGGPLATFRVAERIDDPFPPATFDATRLQDHRPDYLDYEGPVSNHRGEVRRLARGEIEITFDTPRRFRAAGWIGHARGTWEAHATAPDAWAFTFIGQPDLEPHRP